MVDPSGVVRDLIAGVTLALTSIPQAVAYAELSGVAGWRGLATMGFPCMAYALVTGSPWASIGVTSITALMAKTALAEAHETLDEAAYVRVYAAYACAVAVASVALAAGGAGRVAVARIPASVKAGFKLGFGCTVISSQCATALFAGGKRDLAALVAGDAGLFGAAAARLAALAEAAPAVGGLLAGAAPTLRVAYAACHPLAWDAEVALVAAVVLLGTLRGKDLLPKWAPPGLEVLLLVGAAAVYSEVVGYGGAVVGAPPAGAGDGSVADRFVAPSDLPWRRLVDVCFASSWLKLAVSALTFACVDFLQTVSVCSAFEADDGLRWSPDRELAGQGVASAASAAFLGGPCGASLSRSMLARMTGATSRLAGLFHGLAAVLLLNYAHLLAKTPKAALAAVVLAAVGPGVAKPKALLALTQPADALVGWATALASVVADPTTGFLAGLALAAAAAPLKPKAA